MVGIQQTVKLPTQPGMVTLSPEERESGKWSKKNVQKAMEYLHRDGMVAVDGVVDKSHLLKIKESMLKTAQEIKATKTKPSDFNHGVMSNFIQSPPLTDKDLLFPDVYANTFVHQILQAYLGPNPRHAYVASANAMSHNKELRQPVHKDAGFLHPLAPYGLNVSFPLCDFTPENGSTEYWLGTQLTDTSCQYWPTIDSEIPMAKIPPIKLAERAETRPGEQVSLPLGVVHIRDSTVWHAGMPNPSDEDRIMVLCDYRAAWYPEQTLPFKVPETAREVLNSSPLVTTYFEYMPDEKWTAISQTFNAQVPAEEKMLLPPVPGSKIDKALDEGWESLNNMTRPEDKFLLPKDETVPVYR